MEFITQLLKGWSRLWICIPATKHYSVSEERQKNHCLDNTYAERKRSLIAMLLRLDKNTELIRAVALMFRPDNHREFASWVIFLWISHNSYQKKKKTFSLYISLLLLLLFNQVIETLVKVWENSKRSPVVSVHISSSLKPPFVFITRRKKEILFIYLKSICHVFTTL